MHIDLSGYFECTSWEFTWLCCVTQVDLLNCLLQIDWIPGDLFHLNCISILSCINFMQLSKSTIIQRLDFNIFRMSSKLHCRFAWTCVFSRPCFTVGGLFIGWIQGFFLMKWSKTFLDKLWFTYWKARITNYYQLSHFSSATMHGFVVRTSHREK